MEEYDGSTGNITEKLIPRDKVWKNPPQAVFSFDQHDAGDEYIKEKAAAAKRIFEQNDGRKIILSHEDWSNKHFRFLDNSVNVIYDWDSITRIDELYTVGVACSTFTATWYYPTRVFPTPEEARQFVDQYAIACGRTYTQDELDVISAYAAYTLAYIARCVFAFHDGSIKGNDIEEPFKAIKKGRYF